MKKIFKRLVQIYLKILTKMVLWRHRPLIVAIAGTANKTFVKEMILQELGKRSQIRGNPRSFNTEIGLPLAVLFLPSGYSSIFRWVDVLLTGTTISLFSRKFPKILVLELGVDRKGDMEYLLSMVKPSMAVVTRIDRSFPDNNATMDDIADEISRLVEDVPKDGMVILNGDDERVAQLGKYAKSKIILFGQNPKADVKIKNIRTTETGQNFELIFPEGKERAETERFGRHNMDAMVVSKIVAKQIKQMQAYKNLK